MTSSGRVIAKGLVVGGLLVLTGVHLLFAAANLGIGEPAEAAMVLIAAVSLGVGAVMVMRSDYRRAAQTILAGSLVLVLWFVFTVPRGWSSPTLLYLSMVVPGAAATFLIIGRRRLDRSGRQPEP